MATVKKARKKTERSARRRSKVAPGVEAAADPAYDEPVAALLALFQRDVRGRVLRRLEVRLGAAIRAVDPTHLDAADLDEAAALVGVLSSRIDAIRRGLFIEHQPPAELPPAPELPRFSEMPPEAQASIRTDRLEMVRELLASSQGTNPPTITVSELSRRLTQLGWNEIISVTPNALQSMLGRMENRGFVAARPAPGQSGKRRGAPRAGRTAK